MTNPKTVVVPVELLPCPFCGGKPTVQLKGNVHSHRKLTVKCPDCRIQRTDATLRYGDEWLHKIGIDAWNRRATPTPPAEHVQTAMVLEHDGRKFTVPGWIGPHIAELLAKGEQDGEWLPIETAPKDGTLFLGWVSAVRYGEDDAGQPFEHDVSDHDFCRWREMETGGFYENMMGRIGDAQDITHWMPLPAAPSSEGER